MKTTPTAMPIIVRETVAKTILQRSSIGDYSLNCYTGCAHACVYCYARFMQRFHPHPEPWGAFVDVKINAVEVLKRQLRRATPGEVFVSSACDAWQPVEAPWGLSRHCCELLLERDFQVNVLTKSARVLDDLEVFRGRRARIGTTVTTLDEDLCRLWEPGASSVAERLRIVDTARRAGLSTTIMFGPLLPWLSDDEASLAAMFRRAAELDVQTVWVDAINARPRVWPAVASLLAARFPELRERYRRMLFDGHARAAYLADLKGRVDRAARQAGISQRLSVCFS